MFTPILGRVSVQYDCASPGAWAQLHPDNKLNTTVTATRHLIFTDVNTNYTIRYKTRNNSFSFQYPAMASPFLERNSTQNECLLTEMGVKRSKLYMFLLIISTNSGFGLVYNKKESYKHKNVHPHSYDRN